MAKALSLDIICREFVRRLVNVPFGRRGPFPWVSWCDFIPYAGAMGAGAMGESLDSWGDRYLSAALGMIVANPAKELSRQATVGWGSVPEATAEFRAFKAELRTRYAFGADEMVWQFRVFYNPTPLTADVPLYHWLGEIAEAA